MTNKEMRAWIDNACYEALLRRWRFTIAGDPIFQGEMGKYYGKIMAKRREEVGPEEAARTSKRIGWQR